MQPTALLSLALTIAVSAAAACDKDAHEATTAFDAGPAYPLLTASPAPVEPPRAPEIIVDAVKVSIGTDHVAAGEPGLVDKVGVFLTGRPGVAGQVVDVVAMRNAKPTRVLAVVRALRRAAARGVNARTEARDGTTGSLPLSLVAGVADCTTVAWIAKDAAVDVWPAGGGKARRIIKGIAGPDMTLATEAVHKQGAGCSASEMVVGSDDRFTWGLVFDLATMSLQAPAGRAGAALLVDDAVPGRKLALAWP